MAPSARHQHRPGSPVGMVRPSPLKHAGNWGESEYEKLSRLELCARAGKMASLGTAWTRRAALPDYKPVLLRWPFLVAMIVIMLALIAAVETACRMLPAEVDRNLVPRPAITYSSASSITTPTPLMSRMQHPRQNIQNASTTATLPPVPTETLTKWFGDDPSSAANPSETVSSEMAGIGPASEFGQLGYQTQTTTLPAEALPASETHSCTPIPEQRGNAGIVSTEAHIVIEIVTTTLKKTTLEGVVTTVTQQTTLPGVATTATVEATINGVRSTYIRTTTINGTPTTVVGTATLNGVVITITTTSTLNGAVDLISGVRTRDGMIIEYPVATTLRDGVGPSYMTAEVVTLTDSYGKPTDTSTSTPQAISTPTVVTLTDARGAATATVTTSVLAAPRTRVLTDSAGVAAATVTEYLTFPSNNTPQPQTVVKVYYISNGGYFIGFVLPTLLAVMLAIPVRMIDLAAKQLQPWHALTRPHGASAEESLCLRTGGMYGIVCSIRSLAGGQALVFLTTTLTLASIALVPLSAEAVALKLHGSCSESDFRGCAMTLGVFLVPARVTTALLGFMVILTLLILLVLRGRRSGVAANPWSIAAVASLSSNPELRAVFASLPTGRGERITHEKLVAVLGRKTFKLGHFFNHYGVPEYGVMVYQPGPALWKIDTDSTASLKSLQETDVLTTNRKAEHHLPFLMLSYTARIAFLVPLTGMMVLVLYYNNTSGDTAFERFMSTQNSRARSLFSLLGVGISLFWCCFFTSLAALSPYQLLSASPQRPQRSINLAPPLSAFSGIVSAMKQRHVFLVLVAFTAIMSEFMPILLSNVPFRLTQTWIASRTCTWTAVGILGFMWLVIAGSCFVSWPHMPVDPSTIAGAMYYVCDSWMLWSLEGTSALGEEARDRQVAELGLKFRFGDIVGLSGRKRVGVDGLDDYA